MELYIWLDNIFNFDLNHLTVQYRENLAAYILSAGIIITVITILKIVIFYWKKIKAHFIESSSKYDTYSKHSWNNCPTYKELTSSIFNVIKFHSINVIIQFINGILSFIFLILFIKMGEGSLISINAKIIPFSIILIAHYVIQAIASDDNETLSYAGIERFLFNYITVPVALFVPTFIKKYNIEKKVLNIQNTYINEQG